MSTLGDVVDDVLDTLSGYARTQDQVSSLSAAMSTSALAISIADQNGANGVWEIDDELMYVTNTAADGTATVAPWGRGYRGTTVTAHSVGAKVTVNPAYARKRVLSTVNEQINAVWPQLFVAKTYSFLPQAMIVNYDMPADCGKVLRVTWQDISPSQEQIDVRRWRLDPRPTSLGLQILSPVFPGRNVTVLYAPNTSQGTFTTNIEDCGVPDGARDILTYGSCASLLSGSESGRVQSLAAESLARSQVVNDATVLNAAKFFYSLYQQRLADEKAQLWYRYKPQPHFTR